MNERGEIHQARVFACVGVGLLITIFLLTLWNAQRVQNTVQRQFNQLTQQTPWLHDLAIIDGRAISFHGERQADDGLPSLISSLQQKTLIDYVEDETTTIIKPLPFLELVKNEQQLKLDGQLNGATLDNLLNDLDYDTTDHGLSDRIVINDDLADAMWTQSFPHWFDILQNLDLPRYQILAWRDHIEINSSLDHDALRQQITTQIEQAIPNTIALTNRITQQTPPPHAQLRLQADWQGIRLKASLADIHTARKLVEQINTAFGEQSVSFDVSQNEQRTDSSRIEAILPLVPLLADVRNLRLESHGDSMMLWGQIEDPELLGQIIKGMSQITAFTINNNLILAKPKQLAEISLLKRGNELTLTGLLPSLQSKQRLLQQTAAANDQLVINSEIQVTPDIGYTYWLSRWHDVITGLPEGTIGISLKEHNLLLSGDIDFPATYAKQVAALLPEATMINWLSYD